MKSLPLLSRHTSITIYLIIIILISIIGLFRLFPVTDHNIVEAGVAINDITTDSTVQIKGRFQPQIINEEKTGSLELAFDLTSKVQLVDTCVSTDKKNPEVYHSKHSFTFPNNKPNNTTILWLIIIVGIMGASIHALSSISAYVGNDNYKSSWALWYYLRPFVGALLALVSYLLVRAGFLNVNSSDDLYSVLAIAGLIGMFSKQALYKISDIADAIFTNSHELQLKDKITENPVPQVDSPSLTVSIDTLKKDQTIVLKGDSFIKKTKVLYNNNELDVDLRSEKEIKVTVNEDIASKEGEYELEIVNPEPGGGKASIIVKVTQGTETQDDTSTPVPPADSN